MQSKKRKGSPSEATAQRGMWAQMKFSKAQPWSSYGAMRVQRGTAANIERFGSTARAASALQKERRKMTGYTGRGAYGMKTLGRVYKAVKSPSFAKGFKRGFAGGADMLTALTPFEPELAPVAGAAQGISSMMGRGMYTPKSHGVNDLIMGGASSVPTMRTVGDETGALIVTHTERVADIIAPADDKFHVQSFTINAGLEETFPWLHQIASSYEEYEVLQCVFQYKGHEIVGIQDTLDLQGQVIAATKYNVKSKSFTDRHEMQAYPHATSCSLNGTLQAGVEADPKKIASGDTHRYVRTGGLLVDEDRSDYDHARFELALNNTPTDLFNKEVGQLYCYYTIKLSKPRLFGGRGSAISTYSQYAKSGPNTPFGSLSASGTNQAMVASRNSLHMKYIDSASNTAPYGDPKWEFPAHASGKYRCTFGIQGSNLDGGHTDFGSAVLAGEVTTAKYFPHLADSVNPETTQFKLEDGIAGIFYQTDVIVRPQIGSTKNSISFNMSLVGDTIERSFVRIEEVNDYDAGSDLPEVVGVTDKLVKSLD